MKTPDAAKPRRRVPPTEHKIESDSGWSLDRETGNVTPWDGIRIFWRFVGERRWRKIVLVPDEEQGQTIESLTKDVPKVVRVLAKQVVKEAVS